MDTMLILWVIVLYGVSIKSTLAATKESVSTKNDTASSGMHDSPRAFKLKRQLDDIDFDKSSFDGPNIFSKKINGFTTFDEDISSDISAFIPSPSFKVIRSNSDSLGTHDQNFESTNFPPAANFHSGSPSSQPQQQQQSSESQNRAYSGEDQDSLSQLSQTNTAFNNQVTTPYYNGYVNQPNYIAAKSSAFPSVTTYKAPAKVQFNTYPSLTEYTSSIPLYPIPVQPVATSNFHQVQQSVTQNAPFKTLMQGLKSLQANAKVYEPVHRHEQSQQSQQFNNQFQNFGQGAYDIQYTTPAVKINGKKLTLPVLQLQTQEIPGYMQALETTPIIFGVESGLQYKTEPSFGLSYDFSKPKASTINQRSGTNTPFLASPNPATIQILPVQTSSSTAQFPKYKGASVGQFPSRGFSKIPNDYQEFKTQSQLHFNGNQNNKPKNYHKSAFHPQPLEEIRTDVEVINKKKPIPPLPKTDDDDEQSADDDSGESYKSTDSYFPKNDDDEIELPPKNYFKESELEGDFKPSKSFPYKDYDKFGKQKKVNLEIEDDDEDDDTDVNLAAKYHFSSKSEDDDDSDDNENESAEDKPQIKYKPYPLHDSFRSHRSSSNDDDDDDEEGTRKKDRKEKSTTSNKEHYHNTRKSKPSRERGKSYEEDFDDSFRNNHSKPKLIHRPKGSSNYTKGKLRSHSNSRREESTPRSSKKNQHRTYRDETGEPTERPSSFLGSVRYDPQSSENTSSHSQLNRRRSSNKSPKDAWENSYGSRAGSTEDNNELSNYPREEFVVTSKPLAGSLQEFTTRSSTRSATPAKDLVDEVGSSTYSPRSSWKSGQIKTTPIRSDSFSRPASSPIRSLIQTKQNFFNPELERGELFRSLKGI